MLYIWICIEKYNIWVQAAFRSMLRNLLFCLEHKSSHGTVEGV